MRTRILGNKNNNSGEQDNNYEEQDNNSGEQDNTFWGTRAIILGLCSHLHKQELTMKNNKQDL